MISVRNVWKAHQGQEILKGVDLQVATGTSVALIGPSGCGKTTLLRIVAGLDRPDRGEVWIDGIPASTPDVHLPPSARSIGMVFQQPALWSHMTVRENIRFGMGRVPGPSRSRIVEDLLARARISPLADRYPHELSGGEARRVSILRAIAPQPRHLLMDEPMTHMDRDLKQEILEFIREFTGDRGITLLYVTHDPGEADFLGIPPARFRDGRVYV